MKMKDFLHFRKQKKPVGQSEDQLELLQEIASSLRLIRQLNILHLQYIAVESDPVKVPLIWERRGLIAKAIKDFIEQQTTTAEEGIRHVSDNRT